MTANTKWLTGSPKLLYMICFAHRAPTLINVCLLLILVSIGTPATAQDEGTSVYNPDLSIARNWNEALLFAIRRDFARPTVHARNLFHISAAMYDSWALFDETASLHFLGRQASPNNLELPACHLPDQLRQSWRDFTSTDFTTARQTTLSYATYRILQVRFARSPGATESLQRFDSLFEALGFDQTIDSTDISTPTDPATLGNYLAKCVIEYGLNDGANEVNDYVNQVYTTFNPPLDPTATGNPGLVDPNRWQSLQLNSFIDQSGNLTDVPIFLGAEWSEVAPFSLTASDVTPVLRDNSSFPVYLDPGPPALLSDDPATNREYQLGHALVAKWSSHLDPTDGVIWDVSPANFGNTGSLPDKRVSVLDFYNAIDGGTRELGYSVNPVTGEPYAAVRVPRGDYTRVLAEFWADGPDSETPPGHWFQIYNSLVSDHPDFTRRYGGAGEELDSLEYDIRAYFVLGAAMHDSAIAAWSAKAAYDYIRPISALRYMASLGQSSDLSAGNYHIHGVPLQDGLIETIYAGDPLAGNGGVNIGRIKARTWRGPNFIRNPLSDVAGVGWTLLENWWPYQRPSFVTPPFAGYLSGHSTFSRAAADVLTKLTGSEYFPGGLAQFTALKDNFLVFEKGPSVDVTLQWASYRDASDQTSLSRIWGGIHPPVDDLPGRRLGSLVAERAWDRAQLYFNGQVNDESAPDPQAGTENRGGSGCSITMGAGNSDNTLMWLFGMAALLGIIRIKRRMY